MKKISKFFLFSLLMLFSLIITSCNSQNNNGHVHDYSKEWTIDKEATCTEDGSKSHHCLICDKKIDETVIPATGHNFSQWEIVLEATETSTGLKERECSVCHYIDEEVIPKLDHIHNFSSEWTVDVEPTCTEEGSKSHHCLVCDDKTDVTVIEALGHSYGSYEHNDEGHWKICSVCDYELRSDHDFSIKDDLTLVCVCGLEKTVVSDLKFTLSEDGKSYTVNGFNGTSSEILIIPNEYNGLPVLTISDYAFYDYNINSILEKVYISEGIISIGSSAFSRCRILTSIEIPSSVKSIGYAAFEDCSNLTSIEIPSSVTSIEYAAFKDCSNLTSIEIPSSVTSIGDWAFYGCRSLTSIEIPSSVKSIGFAAFEDCSNLTSIEIPSSVTSIEMYAFDGCSNLKNVYINDISSWVLIKFSSLESNPLYYARNLYLNNELVQDLTIPEGVTSIGSYAFSGCSSLTSIEIPSSVTSIGSYAFSGCSSLTIYCEVSSKPSGWNTDWNYFNCPVVWNYKNDKSINL